MFFYMKLSINVIKCMFLLIKIVEFVRSKKFWISEFKEADIGKKYTENGN